MSHDPLLQQEKLSRCSFAYRQRPTCSQTDVQLPLSLALPLGARVWYVVKSALGSSLHETFVKIINFVCYVSPMALFGVAKIRMALAQLISPIGARYLPTVSLKDPPPHDEPHQAHHESFHGHFEGSFRRQK